MGTTLSWQQISIRLAVTLVAGVILGINRNEKGRTAGIGTNVLVSLAASLAMLQANLLMSSVGKAPDSFVVLDLMRLPLGILSGIGFIGAGVILRKGEMVLGVTTAATLWTDTVLGLCFGGGQILLGIAGLALACVTLWGLKWLEKWIPQEHRGNLSVWLDEAKVTDRDLRILLEKRDLHIHNWGISASRGGDRRVEMELRWKAVPQDPFPPQVVEEIVQTAGVTSLEWKS